MQCKDELGFVSRPGKRRKVWGVAGHKDTLAWCMNTLDRTLSKVFSGTRFPQLLRGATGNEEKHQHRGVRQSKLESKIILIIPRLKLEHGSAVSCAIIGVCYPRCHRYTKGQEH